MEVETMSNDSGRRELKHLGFVRVAAIRTFVYVSNLYEFAKQNSGSLRSTVTTAESTVNGVVGPVYDKFKGVPDDLLRFLDKQVDEATHKFDKHAPPIAKQIASQVQCLIHGVSQKAEELVQLVQIGGPRAGLFYVIRESKQLALTQSVKAWRKINQYPSIHKVADAAVPVAENAAEKYNSVVKNLTHKGYALFGYLPLVPVEDIAKAFKEPETARKQDASDAEPQGDDDSHSHSE